LHPLVLRVLALLVALGPLEALAQQPGVTAQDALVQAVRRHRIQTPSTPSASSAQSPCGLIQGKVVLHQDTSCESVDLTTGATLDLNGFTLQGNVSGGLGLGASGATVKNGTLTLGHYDFSACQGCILKDLRIVDGTGPFVLQPGNDNRIIRCIFSGNEVAVDLFFSGRSQITESIFENNVVGVFLSRSQSNQILSNQFQRNGTGVSFAAEVAAFSNTVASNVFAENDTGVSFAARFCFSAVECLNGNRVSHNFFLLNQASGLVFDSTECDSSCSAANVNASIDYNFFVANGFRAAPGTQDNGLTVVGPADVSSGVTIDHNFAVFNKNLGIDAPNATDGGGNLAALNGNPVQCVGVVCTP
jgi:hypothetical protein